MRIFACLAWLFVVEIRDCGSSHFLFRNRTRVVGVRVLAETRVYKWACLLWPFADDNLECANINGSYNYRGDTCHVVQDQEMCTFALTCDRTPGTFLFLFLYRKRCAFSLTHASTRSAWTCSQVHDVLCFVPFSFSFSRSLLVCLSLPFLFPFSIVSCRSWSSINEVYHCTKNVSALHGGLYFFFLFEERCCIDSRWQFHGNDVVTGELEQLFSKLPV